MPYSIETGKYAPKIQNQPKLPIGYISALVASICLAVGYTHSDKVRGAVNTAVEVTIDNLPNTIDEALDSFSEMRKM